MLLSWKTNVLAWCKGSGPCSTFNVLSPKQQFQVQLELNIQSSLSKSAGNPRLEHGNSWSIQVCVWTFPMDGRMYEYVKKRRRSRIKKKGKSSILCILPLCQGSFHSPFDVEPDIRIIMVWKNINLHRKWLLFKYYHYLLLLLPTPFFFFLADAIHYYIFRRNWKIEVLCIMYHECLISLISLERLTTQ